MTKKIVKKLYRSREDQMVAGVASGIAKYFELDPSIVRIVWVLGVLLWGSGAVLYIAFWVIVPEEPVSKKSS